MKKLRFALDGLLNDMQTLHANGKEMIGIEMGRAVWEQYRDEQIEEARKKAEKDPLFDSLFPGIAECPAAICGIPVKIIESLGAVINYVIEPSYIARGRTWMSVGEVHTLESLQKKDDGNETTQV